MYEIHFTNIHGKLLNHARRQSSNYAEDAVQETYLRLLRNNWPRDRWTQPILFKTLGWVLLDHHRRNRNEGPLGLESLRYHSPVEHRILLDELLAAEPHAATVIASEIEGLFPAEIARARRSTPGAVALEKHRAMRRLRKRAVAAQ